MDIDVDYIAELLDRNDSEVWCIENDDIADWAVQRVQEQQEERDRVVRILDGQIAALQAQRTEAMSRFDTRTSFFRNKLRDYFMTVKPRTTKTQAIYQLASGALVLKQQQPEYVRDEQVMLDWARENAPQYIRTTEAINWGELKKDSGYIGEELSLTETGELVPGVTVKQREPVFEVKK